MKRIYYTLFSMFVFLIFISSANASNKLYNLDINIHINEDGSANITEVWKMKLDNGTEVYKPMTNLGSMDISNFKVVDENNNVYTKINFWDVDSSLSEKAYKNGINNISGGVELCWGMSSYGAHIYTISYTLSNFVFNTTDAQVVYYKAVNDSMDPYPNNFNITITSFYNFLDTLDVWGYGYEGYAYVKDGKIELSNKEDKFKKAHYAVVLIKFPLNTFNISYTNNKYDDFEHILDIAQQGASSSENGFTSFFNNLISVISALPFLAISIFAIISQVNGHSTKRSKYIFVQSEDKIKKNEIQNFRDLPTNNDLFRINTLTKIYASNNDSNIIGAILLKWILFDQIVIINLPDKFLKKNRIGIDLKKIEQFDNNYEQKLYDMMVKASKDNILEDNELKNWCRNNYTKLFNWLTTIETDQNNQLITEGHLEKKTSFLGLSNGYIVKSSLKEEGLQILGLKKFLEEFSNIDDKKAIEVKLWKEYLINAQIFGIADKVAEEFKNIIPNMVEYYDGNFDTIITNIHMINIMTSSGMSAAESAKHAVASNYTGGGGGFSSFGGGGGSFGGGSGGGTR